MSLDRSHLEQKSTQHIRCGNTCFPLGLRLLVWYVKSFKDLETITYKRYTISHNKGVIGNHFLKLPMLWIRGNANTIKWIEARVGDGSIHETERGTKLGTTWTVEQLPMNVTNCAGRQACRFPTHRCRRPLLLPPLGLLCQKSTRTENNSNDKIIPRLTFPSHFLKSRQMSVANSPLPSCHSILTPPFWAT